MLAKLALTIFLSIVPFANGMELNSSAPFNICPKDITNLILETYVLGAENLENVFKRLGHVRKICKKFNSLTHSQKLYNLISETFKDTIAKDEKIIGAVVKKGQDESLFELLQIKSFFSKLLDDLTNKLDILSISEHLTPSQNLIIISYRGHVKSLEYIFSQNTLINGVETKICTIPFLCELLIAANIYASADSKDYPVLTSFLIKLGRQINLLRGYSKPLLIYAIQQRNAPAAQDLLENGAEVNVKFMRDLDMRTSTTPLISAIARDLLPIVQLLIEYGADIELSNHKDQTPLIFAIDHNKFDIAEVLIRHNANANAKAANGSTPLSCAIGKSNTKLAKLLILNGAKLNNTNNQGQTPLDISAIHGNLDMVKLLVEHGANVNFINRNGKRSYDYAIDYAIESKGDNQVAAYLRKCETARHPSICSIS